MRIPADRLPPAPSQPSSSQEENENGHEDPRVALVTGGMVTGEAICIKLAALGYKVVTTHSPGNTKSQEWLEGMNKMGYGFRAYRARRCRLGFVRRLRPEGRRRSRVDRCAGQQRRHHARDTTFKKMDRGGWDAVMHTNLDSCVNMTKQVCD
jgi:acetoacetyl-CoA reductase